VPERIRILIVEDNPADVRLVREALRYKGIEPEIEHYETAAAGVKAVQNIPANSARLPDVILLDYNLPAGTARDVLIAIRSNPALTGIKKAVLTCSVAPKDREHAFEAGADLFVFKPATLDQFLEDVGNAISSLLG
jgi:CheY-like chemotaxis protein